MSKNDGAAGRVIRRLTTFYALALVLIGLIVLAYAITREQFIIPPLQRASDSVEAASGENASSQEITKAASALLLSNDRGSQAIYIEELRQVLPIIAQDHARLSTLIDATAEARPLLSAAEPHYNAILDAANGLLTTDAATQDVVSEQRLTALQPYVVMILAEEQPLSYTLQQIAALSSARSDAIESFEGALDKGLLGSILLSLVLVGVFVFRPATLQAAKGLRELERAEEQQRELAALKDQFIIDANHELRTPIMALYNTLELLDAVGQDGKPERRAQLLHRALNSGDTVLRLLTNVLDTSALEARQPRLTLATLSLATLVRSVLETFDPREIGEPNLALSIDQTRAVTMNVPPDLMVRGDELRLRQVLINLISNALKYSEPQTSIQLTAAPYTGPRSTRHRGHVRPEAGEHDLRDLVVMHVRDFGLGVPAHDAPKLFNRFVRLERDIAGTVRGTGVGLYVSRILVEAMGGHIWVDSSGVPGEGSTFSFTIPLATSMGIYGSASEPDASDVAQTAARAALH